MENFFNNLLNIGPWNPAFRAWAHRILERVGWLWGSPRVPTQLWLTAGDAFFAFYSALPVLRSRNPDPFLDTVLRFFRERWRDLAPLRARTVYNSVTSAVYATTFLEALLKELAEKPELRQLLEQPGLQQQQGQQPAQGQQPGQQPAAAPEELLRELEAAVGRAHERAERAVDAASFLREVGVAAGDDPGSLEKALDLAEEVLRVDDAERIIAAAQRAVDALPFFFSREKERGRRGAEVYGYRFTARPENALPRELALPDDLFYARLASGALLAREYVSVREGALYVLLDKSGSMGHRSKLVFSRSVALALLVLARRKGRRYFLRFFDYVAHPLLSSPEEAAEALLKTVCDGGTSVDAALSAALSDLEELSDLTNTIIIITDGECPVETRPEDLLARGARLVAVMVEGSNAALKELAARSEGQYLAVKPGEDGALRLIDALR